MGDKDLEAPEETKEVEAAPPPHHLADQRIRICGKWRKKGYRPTKEELEAWKQKCSDFGLDPKTGKKIEKKADTKK